LAWLAVVAVVMVLWRQTAGKPAYAIQIEFGMDPESFVGAEVWVDGDSVGVLERYRGRTLNGFRVEAGPREVRLMKEGFGSEPTTVDVGGFGSRSLRLMAELEDRRVDGGYRPVMVLR
jgi:hypothetical protein